MAIDYRGLRSLTARELIAALNRDGFYFVRQIGSHQRRGTRPGNGSVRSPGGETVPQGYADAVAEYFRKLSKSK